MVIDDKLSRRTEYIKNTLHPKWKEDLTVLVTPQSELLFRLADYHSFRKDNIIGEKRIHLLKILLYFNGKCDNVELTIGKCTHISYFISPENIRLIANRNSPYTPSINSITP